ncbi:SymE family type I addiction module toxin [Halotalea alkalilenta]|uniref:SymE family type I addiction module toxin n=1 Tax=Halotalea alkalilenta TaxID=376489 RepID=UPI0009DE3BF2
MAEQARVLQKRRFLKIGYHYYESQRRDKELRYRSRQVPTLRLCGDWLQAAGFLVGQKVRVEVTHDGIMITPDK